MAMLNNQMVQFHEPSPMTYQKMSGISSISSGGFCFPTSRSNFCQSVMISNNMQQPIISILILSSYVAMLYTVIHIV